MRIKYLILLAGCSFAYDRSFSQAAPPAGGNAMAISRAGAVQVNNFTGIPAIGVPLYSYSTPSGLSLNVSLDYFAGGVKVADAPGAAGLGWNLNAGGAITRTVRGVPDDCPRAGFLYTYRVQTDPRSETWRYYNGCLDGEQDVFQFNFCGRSGKFYIGKDTQFTIVPLSKMKIRVVKDSVDPDGTLPDTLVGSIRKFIITTETGIKYVFEDAEYQQSYLTGCIASNSFSSRHMKYGTAWYLSKIISFAGKDTISFTYTVSNNTPYASFSKQEYKTTAGYTFHSDTTNYSSALKDDEQPVYGKVPSEIRLPGGKKLEMFYSRQGQFRFARYPLLQRIKIVDSLFRYGYILSWDTTGLGSYSRDFLTGLNYYTKNIIKPGYKFTYNTPYFSIWHGDTTDYMLNKRDHWGYYNGAGNRREGVPSVPGIYTGANREPSAAATAGSLASVQDPAGGITYYDFENNDAYPYDPQRQEISVDVSASSSTAVSLSRQIGNRFYFKIKINPSFTRTGATPVSGAGKLIIRLTNTAGTTTYAADTAELQQLFYTGYASVSCALPSGNYLLKTDLASGTSCSGSLPVLISWYNQNSAGGNGYTIGGIRIKRIRHYDPFTGKSDTLSTYNYTSASGKSSGFLNTKPVYHYNVYPSTLKILANSLNNINYSEGLSSGYSRVEVIKGTAFKNLGKVVYEFTNIDDADFDLSPPEYPFIFKPQKDWAWGLPKRTLLYDNTGRLIQKTENTFNFLQSDKNGDTLNCSFATGNFTDILSSSAQHYYGKKYYPETGTPQLTATADTFYHPDNSVTASIKNIEYDSNYNVKKIITPYDLNRGLNLEQRIYYPYNYTLSGIIGTMRDSSLMIPVSGETWITGDANPRLLSAAITDFQKPPGGEISPYKIYALQSNAPVAQTVIGSFDPSVLIRNSAYFVQQQQMSCDRNALLYQTENMQSGIKNSLIYGYAKQHVIAKISNCSYADAAHTSFEQASDGGFVTASSARDTTAAITGTRSYELSSGQIDRGGMDAAVTYIISYWTKGYVSISGASAAVLTDQRNGWYFYTRTVTGAASVTLYGSGLIDELRLYPKDANMETTCYNPIGQVISVCDANSNIVYNEYDSVNRIRVIRDKDRNIIKKYEYSDSLLFVNMDADWIAFDSTHWACEKDLLYQNTGRVLREEIDSSSYSETYLSTGFVFDHTDSARCAPPPPDCGSDPAVKLIGGICETGCKNVTAGVYTKIQTEQGNIFVWVCTYHYEWSDHSSSGNYTEHNPSSCPLGNPCDE